MNSLILTEFTVFATVRATAEKLMLHLTGI